jgi:hypothetical protein
VDEPEDLTGCLRTAAVLLVIPVAALSLAMGWFGWMALRDALSLFSESNGVIRAYLLTGAFSTSYIVAQLVPGWVAEVRRVMSKEGDSASRLVVGLWKTFPYLWGVGFFAGPATGLWPLALPIFRRWRKKRSRMQIQKESAADEQEVEAIRAEIRKSEPLEGP